MTAPYATWDLLKDLGFLPDPRVWSDIQPGLRFDFGNLILSAGAVTTGWQLTPVILFTGIMQGPRSIAEVQFEMPRTVDSPEMCAAWIVWHLDQLSDGDYHPARGSEWLAIGRANKLQLPWVIDMEAYDKRPHCSVEKEWARMMLKRLQAALVDAKDTELVRFEFDGKLLLVRCGEQMIPGEAKGLAWTNRFVLKASQLRELPRRLGRNDVGFSVWNGRFQIANWSYEGVVEEERV